MAKYCDIDDQEIILSSKAMQYVFGISDRTLTNWERDGCPKLGMGRWPLSQVLKWRSGALDYEATGNDRAALKDKKLKAEALKTEEQARKAKMEREVLEGKYILKEDAYKAWASRIVELKSGLMNLTKSLPPEVADQDARTAEAAIRREVVNLLEQYSREGEYTPKVEKAKTSKT
jgi:phage terminase Nu1 subunit (DNA packaging protein)